MCIRDRWGCEQPQQEGALLVLRQEHGREHCQEGEPEHDHGGRKVVDLERCVRNLPAELGEEGEHPDGKRESEEHGDRVSDDLFQVARGEEACPHVIAPHSVSDKKASSIESLPVSVLSSSIVPTARILPSCRIPTLSARASTSSR